MFRTLILSLAIVAGSAGSLAAQPFPPGPFPPPIPYPESPVDGVWYFRGISFLPCSVQTAQVPGGSVLLVTNEKGTTTTGWLSRDGRRVTIPDWNLVGTFRGNALVWPNGDFWSR